nr:MAG TPA: hypothetical protein [Caudoviricetes sp.]
MNSKCQDVILIYSLFGCPLKGSFIYSLHCRHRFIYAFRACL